MATNLKTSKKIRAFCYRLLAWGAFFVMTASGLMGREALEELGGNPSVLSGDLYDLSIFREYIGDLYQNAMFGYVGVGDDNGYPLQNALATDYSVQAYDKFRQSLEACGEELLYDIRLNDSRADSNFPYPIFSEYDGHLLLPDNVRLCCYWDGSRDYFSFFSRNETDYNTVLNTPGYNALQYRPNQEKASYIRLVIALKEQDFYTSPALAPLDRIAKGYRRVLLLFFSSAFLTILFALLSLLSYRAAREATKVYGIFVKKVWLETKLVVVALLFLLGNHYHLDYLFASLDRRISIFPALGLYALFGGMFYLLLTDLRQNEGAIFYNSLPVKLYHFLREYISGKTWLRKAMQICVITLICAAIALICGAGGIFLARKGVVTGRTLSLSGILGILLLLSGVLLLFASLRLRHLVKDTAAIVAQISALEIGGQSTPLTLSKHSLLTRAAEDLYKLEAGIENAVEQKNRSNRMRVELLTNVSHDLKTPLTSIINYADLLCEEPLPAPACEYAQALREKSYRLKNMVQDVFDLSKSTSGNLTVEKHVLDLVKLIRQTLADMDERIAGSTLTFKLAVSEEPILIEADGDKLYRVFQNLFLNALQYSLENSRVHVLLFEADGRAICEVKNTSKGELDFDTSEIIERFVRADTSRTTEGSGLGLSIVQSFTENCGGNFSIETNADMFTARVSFPLTEHTDTQNPTTITESS